MSKFKGAFEFVFVRMRQRDKAVMSRTFQSTSQLQTPHFNRFNIWCENMNAILCFPLVNSAFHCWTLSRIISKELIQHTTQSYTHHNEFVQRERKVVIDGQTYYGGGIHPNSSNFPTGMSQQDCTAECLQTYILLNNPIHVRSCSAVG